MSAWDNTVSTSDGMSALSIFAFSILVLAIFIFLLSILGGLFQLV